MTDTANLGLPFIEAAQAQKHVTHNEALCILDTLVQLAVLDRDLTAPPGSLSEGERWIVAASATGDWAGHDNDVAAWQDGAWQFSPPKVGWVAYAVDEGTLLTWNGSAWGDFFSTVTALQNLGLLGVGTTADATNPFNAKLNNALWTAKTVAEGGDGNLRYKLSKETASGTLSLLLQDNFSGRAEIGLTGDDDFHFKVSADGSAWSSAMTLARATGNISFGAATEATSTSAAAAVFAGGVGIAKRLYVGGAMQGTTLRMTSTASGNSSEQFVFIRPDESSGTPCNNANGAIRFGTSAASRWAIGAYNISGDLQIAYEAANSFYHKFIGNGVVVGTSVAGGNKGLGTLNASAVYDDNVLLTDYVFDRYFGEASDYSTRVAAKAQALDDTMFDPRAYAAYFAEHRRLWGMPDLNDCIDGIVKDVSLGGMVQLLWQTAELNAIHVARLEQRLTVLEEALAAVAR